LLKVSKQKGRKMFLLEIIMGLKNSTNTHPFCALKHACQIAKIDRHLEIKLFFVLQDQEDCSFYMKTGRYRIDSLFL
jgi:hypothetical protein